MNGHSELAIETTGLTKVFGSKRAVDGIDLAVKRGSVHGFLGPNGAGKTTATRLLATLLRPDAGSARVLGFDTVLDAHEVHSRVALTGQYASLDEDLTGTENLMLLARLLGFSGARARRRSAELLEACDLIEDAAKQVKAYSGGMRRRLDIAASIIVTPELLFLDEPTTGLDPRSRNQVWGLIRSLASCGTTVLLTTQYLDEADQLTDRISVFDCGKVIAEGTPSQLKASVGSGALHMRLRKPEQRAEAKRLLEPVLQAAVTSDADPLSLTARVSDMQRVARALDQLAREGIEFIDFAHGQASLDEVFLALTGHAAVIDAEQKKEMAR